MASEPVDHFYLGNADVLATTKINRIKPGGVSMFHGLTTRLTPTGLIEGFPDWCKYHEGTAFRHHRKRLSIISTTADNAKAGYDCPPHLCPDGKLRRCRHQR